MTKINVLIYTGHGEIVGGDAKFIFDTLQHLDMRRFSVTLVTDINPVFKEAFLRAQLPHVQVTYLPTAPKLFKLNFIEKLYRILEKRKDHSVWGLVYKFASKKIKSRMLYRYLLRLYDYIILKSLWSFIHNLIFFSVFFRKNANRYDIFHFNNGGYPAKQAGLVAILVAKFYGIKSIILSIHNTPEQRKFFQINRYFYDYFTPRSCQAIIVPSQKIQNQLAQFNHSFERKVQVLYCGIENKVLCLPEIINAKKRELNISVDKLILLLVGNYEEKRKGHHIVIEALCMVVAHFSNVMFVIVGSGSAARKEYLLDLARQYHVDKNILFLGSRTDIHEINSMSDIVLVPSTEFEATPYTIKEGSRAAKPIITTTAGGCEEGIIPNETGLLIEPNNVDELARAILNLLRSKDLREKMGQAGRQFFERKFLLQKQIQTIESIYAGCIEQ